MQDKRQLWESLKSYRFDDLVPTKLRHRVAQLFGSEDASTLAFAAKLARKNGWTSDFTLRAILEYKKFVFLGLTGTSPVTPSKIIDKVWHQHLQFTAGYRHFCQTVLQRHFDHHPELVPFDEQTEQFDAQYHQTLERYQVEFHMDPPADIWGTPKFLQKLSKKKEEGSGDSGSGSDMMLWQHYTPAGKSSDPGCISSDFNEMICKPVGITHSSLIDSVNADTGDGSCGSGCSGGGCGGD